jgi:hypothetical protein
MTGLQFRSRNLPSALPLIQNVATIRGIQCDGLLADRACVHIDEHQKSIHHHAMHPDIPTVALKALICNFGCRERTMQPRSHLICNVHSTKSLNHATSIAKKRMGYARLGKKNGQISADTKPQ